LSVVKEMKVQFVELSPPWNGLVADDAVSSQQTSSVSPLKGDVSKRKREGSAYRKLSPPWNGLVADDAVSSQQTSIVSPLKGDVSKRKREGSAYRKLSPPWNGLVADDAVSSQQTSIVSPLKGDVSFRWRLPILRKDLEGNSNIRYLLLNIASAHRRHACKT
jgi:hypothetical protein